MKNFSSYHPVALLIYFILILTITMFISNPVLLILSLTGAWIYNLLHERTNLKRSLMFDLLLLTVITITNPIFNHHGKTILFFLNGQQITLEALIYGVCMGVMMLAVIHWCKALTNIMTSDKLLYLCGRIMPNLSIILSMALRYVPLFRIQSAKVDNSQTALGLYTEEGYMAKAKGSMRVFSIVLTWSLENAIDTADSMRARGYGIGKRSQYVIFRVNKSDVLLILFSILLNGIILYTCSVGFVSYEFYPKLSKVRISLSAIITYIACGLFVFMPVLIELKEKLRWKLYRSKI